MQMERGTIKEAETEKEKKIVEATNMKKEEEKNWRRRRRRKDKDDEKKPNSGNCRITFFYYSIGVAWYVPYSSSNIKLNNT